MIEIPLTIKEAYARLRSGQLSCVALTEAIFQRADELDKRLGAYTRRFDETALASAAAADAELAASVDRGPLHGIPVGIKDLLAASEAPTTAQSLVIDPTWWIGLDAPIVARLRKAGAIIAGKTTMMEYAVGMPDASKPFPLPRNPWDLRTWPGGSSSGSASGVAAGLFLAGIGTDTGGSVRLPAAFCGVSGMMPTFGMVPTSGCIPLAFSLDRVGPIARSAWDCAALLEVLIGHGDSDPSSVRVTAPEYVAGLNGSLTGVRVGADWLHHFPDDVDPALHECFESALSVLERLGATISEVSLPLYQEMVIANTLAWICEALAYHRQDMQARWQDYFAGTRLTLARGALVSGADYVQTLRVRRAGQHQLQKLFHEVDLVVMPTTAGGALAYDEHDAMISNDRLIESIFTAYWNAVGNPVLAIPMGFTRGGLPLSLQIAGRPFEDGLVLRTGDAFQSATSWHLCVPPLVRRG